MGDSAAASKAKPNSNSSPPAYAKDEAYLQTVILKRIALFESINNQQTLNRLALSPDPILITLPDGKEKSGQKWNTTPFDVAKEISKSLASNALIAKVNGVLWDMNRPLEGDCKLELFTFDTDEGRDTFWHSKCTHSWRVLLVLGVFQSLEQTYGCRLCIGPCTTRGEGFYYDAFYGDLGLNEEHFRQIEAAAKKAVDEKQPFERIEVTREQALEIFSDNQFKVEIIKDLPEDKTITVYRCGPLVDLCRGPHIPNTSFVKAFSCLKASSAYWRGNKDRESLQRVYGISYPDQKRLKEYKAMLEEAKKYDHRELTKKQELFFFHPLRFARVKKWIEYGKEHLYADTFNVCQFKWNLKVETNYFAELPLRLADFGVLHRNEASGALTGLTRVRRFQQRPEKYLGDIEVWEKAETALAEALNEFGKPWEINEGDGAFYGPKIDISVSDAMRRKFQCATLQERPVMIHRAILGSVERMFAILLEHFKGKWPFWLSPRQAIVCPVSDKSQAYALEVREAQLAQYNYILVVGEKEVGTGQVSVRIRDSNDANLKSIDDLLNHFKDDVASFR
ncbi:hypothetical protein DH2020_034115 [Rehmannia glutinosa]|uniref:TGS domain-containing protein n=1 Tax=Rehmannia glutinosa TaxID=99300 RepID=A0ABR0VD37_REHGL